VRPVIANTLETMNPLILGRRQIFICDTYVEAFPWSEAPRYLIRDRDRIYGDVAMRRIRAMGICDKPIAPASPWQNGFAERLIGSIRRECLDHLVVKVRPPAQRVAISDHQGLRPLPPR
jgi:hypothetical protein